MKNKTSFYLYVNAIPCIIHFYRYLKCKRKRKERERKVRMKGRNEEERIKEKIAETKENTDV